MSAALLAISHAEVMTGFWVSLAFPLVTRLFWPWNESWWGWNIVLLDLSISGTLFPSWLYLTFGVGNTGLQMVQVIFLGLVIANIVWRGVIIWRTQRRAVIREREPV